MSRSSSCAGFGGFIFGRGQQNKKNPNNEEPVEIHWFPYGNATQNGAGFELLGLKNVQIIKLFFHRVLFFLVLLIDLELGSLVCLFVCLFVVCFLASRGFYLVLPNFFFCCITELQSFSFHHQKKNYGKKIKRFLLGFTGFYWVLLGLTGFDWV